MKDMPKILVIVGPTASGKSDLAVKLAKEFNGEVVSADSRQVYTDLDIGTGKITRQEMEGVPHHLLDVADPKHAFNVIDYVKLAEAAVAGILKRGKLPIICGGTGFYIQALIDQTIFPEVTVNQELRDELSKKEPVELLKMIAKLDGERAKEISANPSDSKNARRIIRAIEIAKASAKVPPRHAEVAPLYAPIFIGINPPIDQLRKKIHTRLQKRLEAGMLDEAKRLHEEGLSWERMDELGLEYRYMARFFQGEISKDEMIERLNIEIGKYAKRQMTWFKRDTRIKWFGSADLEAIEMEVRKSI